MLTVGSALGPYEITSTLGAGGMGIVFRARDARLKRDVALKVLPAAFWSTTNVSRDFSARRSCSPRSPTRTSPRIYGLEESDGVRALVMELVEGETLGQRIARGAMPVAEALAIARQIAEALEHAHEHGILHRDLKPANIKVTRRRHGEGARLRPGQGAGHCRRLAAACRPTTRRRSRVRRFTQAGMLLGTAAYMSPEQARGRAVDKRADIWAFGCVLFEMLAGRRLFDGETRRRRARAR